jgi:hypothetical protein
MPDPAPFAVLAVALSAIASAQGDATTQPAMRVLEGRVVDLRGDGVPAAKVWSTTVGSASIEGTQTVADGEGFFRVKVPAADTLQVHAAGDGTCRGLGFARRTTTAVRVQVHDAVTVRGVLRNRGGQPAADTIVRAYPAGRVLRSSHAEARTGADGHFTIPGVPLGPTRVVAWLDGEGLAEAELRVAGDCDLALAPLDGATTDLRIELAGMPAEKLATASVRLLPYANGSLRELPPPLHSVRFDAEGAVQLRRLPDHQYRVGVGAEGFVIGPDQQTAEPGKGPHVLRFRATPAVATELDWNATVQGPDGKPVAGVTFVMRASNGGREARATSDADGRAVFACPLARGSKVIVYAVDDRWVVDQTKVQDGMFGAWDRRFLDDHECTVDPSTPLALRVVPACTVRGRLTRPGGQPAAFADVHLEERRDGRTPEWMTMASTTTDRDGVFRFLRLHHLDDPVRVMVNSVNGAVTGEPIEIAAAGTAVTVPDLQLAPPAVIEGVVRDAGQRPAPGVRVWLRDWDLAKGTQRSGSVTEVITDRQGRYRFVGAPPGGAYLQLLDAPGERHSAQRAVEPFDVEPGKTHVHELQLPAR